MESERYAGPKLKRSFHTSVVGLAATGFLATGLLGMGLLSASPVAAAPAGAQTAAKSVQERSGRPVSEASGGPTEPGDLAERAPEPPPPGAERTEYRVRPAESEIAVDGVLEEPAWAAAAPIPLPFETAPGDNEPAPVRTACFVTFDAEHLYLGCAAHDPEPEKIRAYFTDRDGTGGHDRIVLAVDPFNDARRAFEFGISALGVQSDAVYDEQSGRADDSWDAIWASAGRIAEEGYVVEAAIPFKSLRFPETVDVQTWGFHARREWPRSERVETRSMRWDRSRACVLCQANLITGIEGVSPGLNLELNPTLTATKKDERADFPSGEIEAGDPEPELGLDARWSITTDLALNATFNPDFSQVEADAPQLDVNNRFALFFPEKRPFFLEGADLFQTPLQAVFTRTVADPAFGTKLTGKLGANALGAMVTLDEVNNLLLPSNQGSRSASLDREVTAAFGRFRRDIGASSTIGLLYTGRIGDGYGNHVFGADAFFRPLPALSVRAQVLHSETEYPEEVTAGFGQPEDAFGGNAASLQLAYTTRDWFGNARVEALDPDFRADAGFIPRVDVKRINAWGGRNFWPGPGSPLTRVGVNGGFWHTESWGGELNEEGLWGTIELQGPWQSRVWLNPNLRRERFAGETYEFRQLWAGTGLQPSGTLGLNLWGAVGGAIDYTNARQADQIRLNPSMSLRLGRHADLRASLSWQRLSRDDEEILTAAVSELRAIYNFDSRALFRAIVQLRDTHRNPAMHADPVTPDRTAVTSQLLFSYKVNPLTVLFLGYSDDRLGRTEADRTEVSLTQRERAFFLKLGYAWRP